MVISESQRSDSKTLRAWAWLHSLPLGSAVGPVRPPLPWEARHNKAGGKQQRVLASKELRELHSLSRPVQPNSEAGFTGAMEHAGGRWHDGVNL